MAGTTRSKIMLDCPLCPYEDEDVLALALHVDQVHLSGDSTVDDDNTQSSRTRKLSVAEDGKSRHEPGNGDYLPCPEDDCGEIVLWKDLREHLDLHLAEYLSLDGHSPSLASSSSASNMYAYSSHPSYQCFFPLPRQISDPLSQTSYHSFEQDFQYLHFGSTGQGFSAPDQVVERSGLSRHEWTSSNDDSFEEWSSSHCRLGYKELGPFAYEERMPPWLFKLLSAGGESRAVQRIASNGQLYRDVSIANEVSGIVPVLATLLTADARCERAWLCHPAVQHVHKLKKEGGFCGYRNTQMMLSFVLGTKQPGYQRIPPPARKDTKDGIPGILEIQRMIERAWDMGFNSHARMQTGGIEGTRKYIGTPELHALLNSVQIPCTTSVIIDTFLPATPSNPYSSTWKAHEQLLSEVEHYFIGRSSSQSIHQSSATSQTPTSSASSGKKRLPIPSATTRHVPKVTQTLLPPIYLQQPGHSLTIVGFEMRDDGERVLIVLDPAYRSSPGVEKLLEARLGRPSGGKAVPMRKRKADHSGGSDAVWDWIGGGKNAVGERGVQAGTLLEAYRRGEKSLGRFNEFEILTLDDDREGRSGAV